MASLPRRLGSLIWDNRTDIHFRIKSETRTQNSAIRGKAICHAISHVARPIHWPMQGMERPIGGRRQAGRPNDGAIPEGFQFFSRRPAESQDTDSEMHAMSLKQPLIIRLAMHAMFSYMQFTTAFAREPTFPQPILHAKNELCMLELQTWGPSIRFPVFASRLSG
ncbi:hypothetical protein CIRG_04241 [Coccidioides immitis RMSCC 2394]|uniref:Uncharacterized protein n=2 Tax=Coccidioides immitis TaxID=5501 RepID=A0A0J6YBY2_COCIT|nr:hypothetical protein CIRG_04241 [Coccidioides immitis RMSCC 2394]